MATKATFLLSLNSNHSSPSLKGHCLERTPLYKGHKLLAASTINVCNATCTVPLTKGHLPTKCRIAERMSLLEGNCCTFMMQFEIIKVTSTFNMFQVARDTFYLVINTCRLTLYFPPPSSIRPYQFGSINCSSSTVCIHLDCARCKNSFSTG